MSAKEQVRDSWVQQAKLAYRTAERIQKEPQAHSFASVPLVGRFTQSAIQGEKLILRPIMYNGKYTDEFLISYTLGDSTLPEITDLLNLRLQTNSNLHRKAPTKDVWNSLPFREFVTSKETLLCFVACTPGHANERHATLYHDHLIPPEVALSQIHHRLANLVGHFSQAPQIRQ